MDWAAEPQSDSVPWYLWCLAAAVTAANIGGHWDISWHRSIGRVSFWTPSHSIVYLSWLLTAIASGYLIAATTFYKSSYPWAATVRMWGCRGPLGAFLAAWGCAAMLASAPFDAWWHGAYGLDLKIMSPPHVLLLAGVFAIQSGILTLIGSKIHRAEDTRRRALAEGRAPTGKAGSRMLAALQLYTGSMTLVLFMTIVTEFVLRPYMHSAIMYRAVAIVAPAVLAGVSRAAGRNLAATFTAAGYSVFWLLMLWLLPLFPATPQLGPIYTNVTQMIPLEFPLLLMVPAILLDILYLKIGNFNKFLLGLITGVVFLVGFFFAQWEFAGFLQSPAARNWIFGTHYLDFNTRPDSIYALHKFSGLESLDPGFRDGMWIALGWAIVSAWVGLIWGDWIRRIRR